MTKYNVGTAPTQLTGLGRGVVIIQNLGPGTVYLDSTIDVSSTESFKLDVDGIYETPRSGGDTELFLLSTQANTDVRVVSI